MDGPNPADLNIAPAPGPLWDACIWIIAARTIIDDNIQAEGCNGAVLYEMQHCYLIAFAMQMLWFVTCRDLSSTPYGKRNCDWINGALLAPVKQHRSHISHTSDRRRCEILLA